MHKKNEFHTFRGYDLQNRDHRNLSPSMEDYLEMIFRLSKSTGFTRIIDLATGLNVRPSSATKMVQRLSKEGYLLYEKYGVIRLTLLGQDIGQELLKRHETLEKFLHLLGVRENLLNDTEKIEHSLSSETLGAISLFVEFMQEHQELLGMYNQFYDNRCAKATGEVLS